MDKTQAIFNQIPRATNNDLTLSGIASNQWGTTAISGGTSTNVNWHLAPDKKSVTFVRWVKVLGIKLYKKVTEVSVADFFQKMKKDAKQILIIDGIVDKYLKSLEKAEKFGQTALAEKLRDDIEVVKREALASAHGVNTYLTKHQVDSLLAKSTRNIEITFIKNFTRPIPDELIDIKEKLDVDHVFDAYIVMHYDPKKENSALTKKEVEKKKDPILFGLIHGSTNMYYIGDWVDEYCNLTLKEVVSIINDKEKVIYEAEKPVVAPIKNKTKKK